MAYNNRLELYRQIEAMRGSPLIVYVTSSRPSASAQMASDVIPQFTKQLMQIPREGENVDVLIVSNGGDPTVSWRIVSLIRERFARFGVLLPYAAFSAATLLALGADEIVMHPFSNLGPVDPQLRYPRRIPTQPGQPENVEMVNFWSEDLRNFLDYARTDVGISDQEQLERVFELVCKEVGAIPIGVARRSSQLALAMGEQLLNMHLNDSNKAKAIAETLNRSFYHHGYPLGRTEAEKIGLPVVKPEADLEQLLWRVWEDVEDEMQCNKAFDPIEVVLSDPATAALIGPVQQLQLPANLPQQILQQVLNNVLQQINLVQVNPVDYELLLATLESVKCKSEFRIRGKINATRLPNLSIGVSVIKTSQGWAFSLNESENQALEAE